MTTAAYRKSGADASTVDATGYASYLTGTVGSVALTPVVAGTGALAAQAATLSGAGVTSSTGTGTLAAAASTLAGVGTSRSIGTGTLAAQASTLAGTGTISDAAATGTGALAAGASTLAGSGTSRSTGTGTLTAAASTLAGTGAVAWTATGTLAAQASTLAGAGTSRSTGTGALVAQASTLAGTGSLGTAYDSATVAWYNAVIAAGGTVSTGRKDQVDTLIKGLKTDGLFAKLDRLWLFAAENRKSALVDLIAAASATEVNTPGFATDSGYSAGSVGTSYIETNYNPFSDGPQYTGAAASYGAWSRTSAAIDISLMGDHDGGCEFLPRNSSNLAHWKINEAGSYDETASSDGSGFWSVDRSSSTASRLYRNGAAFGTAGTVVGSTEPVSTFVVVGDTFSNWDGVCSVAYFGAHLTATQQTNLYNRVNTYMTAVTGPPIGTGAVVEARDTAAATGAVASTGTGVLTAAASALTGAGAVSSTGTGALAAQVSAVAGAGTSRSTGTGALNAQASTVAGTGTIGAATVTGTGALNAQDSAVAGTGTVLAVVTGTGTAVEAADVSSASGSIFIVIIGTGAATETADSAASSGALTWLASAAATETGDTAASTGSVAWPVITGTAAALETADTAASSGSSAWVASGAAVETADTAASTGIVAAAGTIAGIGNALESADICAGTGSVTGVGIGVPPEVPPVGVGSKPRNLRGLGVPLYRKVVLKKKRKRQEEEEQQPPPPPLPIVVEPVPFHPVPSLLDGLVKPPDPVQQLLQKSLAVEVDEDEDEVALLLESL